METKQRAPEEIIKAEVAVRGRITFADFMELALYHPLAGYYTRDQEKIGAEGDFYTSSDVTPLFGYALTEQFVQMWESLGRPQAWQLVEYGAGKGILARDVLTRLSKCHPDAYRALDYVIIEISPSLRERQRAELFKTFGDGAKVRWLDGPGDINPSRGITGCVFSNELVDAFPVHRVRKVKGELKEIYVTCREGQLFEDMGFLSCPGLRDYLAGFSVELEEGQTVEINLAAEKWLWEVSSSLNRGFLLTIDYGARSQEIYTPFRHGGNLRSYSRHRIIESPLEQPGCCDITTHVNFTALKKWGDKYGLAIAGYTSQMHFLLSLGILEMVNSPDNFSFDVDSVKKTMAVKKLIMPEGMGNVFKVLAQYKGFNEPPTLRGFTKNLRL